MENSFLEERIVLRLRLQAQRQVFSQQLFPLRPNADDICVSSFPRSMTMRLLTQRHAVGFMIVTEIFPLLFRVLLQNSSFRF